MVSSHSDRTSRPRRTGTQVEWCPRADLVENRALPLLGLLQSYLACSETSACRIDIRYVEWADPLSLLYLGLLMAESPLGKEAFVINIGSTDPRYGTDRFRIFRKFLSQQGFLTALSDYAIFKVNGHLVTKEERLTELKNRFSAEHQATHFQNASCLSAQIIRVDVFRNNESLLHERVEQLIREAQERAIDTAFGGEPLARDMLFQKLRKLLFELLLNVAEHSHGPGVPAYAGIYARIRGAKPTDEKKASAWESLFDAGTSIYGQSQFKPNPYAEWLELYVVDAGCGLLSHMSSWTAPTDPDVAKDLASAIAAKNPLEAIAVRLFRNALSRHVRHDSNRTAVTGLQHLGHLLAVNGDYCRLYTQHGSWVGGHLPWDNSYSRKDLRDGYRDTRMEKIYHGIRPVSGTAYAFSIQPEHRNTSNITSVWQAPDSAACAAIIRTLSSDTTFNPPLPTEMYDRRTQNSCWLPDPTMLPKDAPSVLVLRPPRFMSKADVSTWLRFLAGDQDYMPVRHVSTFVLADLSPFQMLSLYELLKHVIVASVPATRVYLVSEQWSVICLRSEAFSDRLIESKDDARAFLGMSQSKQRFSVAQLAVLLRQMDSELFWRSDERPFAFFFNGPVEWRRSTEHDEAITLRRYLDFAQALANPERYRACRRALRRCLALYPGSRAEGADDLVDALVKDVMSGTHMPTGSDNPHHVIVGSVAVTSGTVVRLEREHGGNIVHMMVHGDAKRIDEPKALSALLWISDIPGAEKEEPPKVSKALPRPLWRRISNTPYIAPRGDQAISLFRYRRNADGSLNFAKPWYGRTPQEMYDDFNQLGVIRTGHWKYGALHDLVTVNIGLAFRYSTLELGALHTWILEQFRKLFGKPGNNKPPAAHLLIYPSHPVTDAIFDRIRQDRNFDQVMPNGGMIPVKFLGRTTVSPLLASHLVAAQIERQIHELDVSSWSAAIVDDGVVSGKHMRELTQFLQARGARTVYTLAILDRTGLPVQEEVLEKYFDRHRRFWRWDVPPLGNKRDCPLCQALAITQMSAHHLPSARQEHRLKEWSALWRVRDIESEWQKGGMTPVQFSKPFNVTFGVDEQEDGDRIEHELSVQTSTAATALLLELTRLTTRPDITLKKAKLAAAASKPAAIEIVAAQLLLFLDELTVQQKRERFAMLLKLIWAEPIATHATSLAGLSMALVDEEIIKSVWSYCRTKLLPVNHIGNLDTVLAINVLRCRYEFITKTHYCLDDNANDIERSNYVMLGENQTLRRAIRDFLDIYRNPNVGSALCAHQAELQTKLNGILGRLEAYGQDQSVSDVALLLRDVRRVEQIIINLTKELVVRLENGELDTLSRYVTEAETLLGESRTIGSRASSILQLLRDLRIFLYGDSKNIGILRGIVDQLFKHYKDKDDLDNELIGQSVRRVRGSWNSLVTAKEADIGDGDKLRKRWRDKDGDVIEPDIRRSDFECMGSTWLYHDSFINKVVEEALCNVFHASQKIVDPWKTPTDSAEETAHLWWRASITDDHLLIQVKNATGNLKIKLKQTVNIAGLERVGGHISAKVEQHPSIGGIAYTVVHIPIYKAFIKESR